MNKILITLSLTLAASTGAFARSGALDISNVSSFDGSAVVTSAATTNDLVSYNRADNDGSPVFLAPKQSIDYTPTASIGGGVSTDLIVYDRVGNDGSPRFH